MKNLLRYAVACAVLSAVSPFSVHGADGGTKPPNPQTALADCAHEAKGLKGDEREKFVAKCIKAGGVTAKQASAPALEGQQNKMKKCNEEAGKKALRGDERRAFMSTCLKA